MTPPARSDFRFVISLSPRWGDMDALGHVNNVKFFTYDESARLEYFQQLMQGDPKFWMDYGLILARIEADFLAQLKLPAQLEIGFRIAKIGRSSMQTEAAMFREGQVMAVTRGVVVWFDYVNNKPLPIPDGVRAQIKANEAILPEEKS